MKANFNPNRSVNFANVEVHFLITSGNLSAVNQLFTFHTPKEARKWLRSNGLSIRKATQTVVTSTDPDWPYDQLFITFPYPTVQEAYANAGEPDPEDSEPEVSGEDLQEQFKAAEKLFEPTTAPEPKLTTANVTTTDLIPDFGSYLADLESCLSADPDSWKQYNRNPVPFITDLLSDHGHFPANCTGTVALALARAAARRYAGK